MKMTPSLYGMSTKSWTLRLPVPVEFGQGSLKRCGEYLTGIRRVLVVTGKRAMKTAGVTDALGGLLTSAGIEYQVFDQVSPDPGYVEVDEAARQAREFQAGAIIGCGGGSALDSAKAIAVAATHPGSSWDYVFRGPRQVTAATLPIIAITTTSGTGSHVGRIAVLSDHQQKVKRPIFSDYLYPRAAICDPEILCHMPQEVTATSGFDAFAQALEGFLSQVENPMGNLGAQEALRIIPAILPRVLERPDDLELRSMMAWADTLQGFSLATNAVLAPHAIAMVLGGRHKISHARAIASVMVPCLRHSRKGAVAKLAYVARLMGCTGSLSDESLADWAIEAIEGLIRQLGLKKSPKDYGVAESEHESIAREVRETYAMRLDVDPAPKTVDDLALILEEANR
jgi:alcohol dehydrogenase class IV